MLDITWIDDVEGSILLKSQCHMLNFLEFEWLKKKEKKKERDLVIPIRTMGKMPFKWMEGFEG